jgi:3-oxoacyl-[acyl-carrier-protein] synthase-1/3-oxoacyl-[acyl-carrier-protein] synthase II
MTPVGVVAASAVSALGCGRSAFAVGGAGALAPVVIGADAVLASGGLRRPLAARVGTSIIGDAGTLDPERPARLLGLVATELAHALDERLDGWQKLRLGYVIGTSGGAMDALRAALGMREGGSVIEPRAARAAPYFAPLGALEPLPPAEPGLAVQVLAACASSTIAIGLGCRWIDLGRCDIVIAGGYDALSTFIAAGFEALGATSASRPAPFRLGRDGMALGEGAALLALARPEIHCGVHGWILGFGASCDAVHVTAPDRSGRGLASAATAALRDAGVEPASVDLVSAHATATPFNDAAEARALELALGPRARGMVVHPFKASVGHTLGAAGALETLAVLDVMASRIRPAAAGSGAIDPDFRGSLLERNEPAAVATALKLSAAFGGANAALVLGRADGNLRDRPSATLEPRAVHLVAVGAPSERLDPSALGERGRQHETKLSRLDPLSECTVAAAADVVRRFGLQPEADRVGIVVGTISATIEADEVFDARLRSRGLRAAEPRRFPATSPNLCAGQCAIALGVTGPVLSVGAGLAAPVEALLVAHDLLASGDADEIVVVAVDEVGPAVRALWTRAGWPIPAHGAVAALLSTRRGIRLDRACLVNAHTQVAEGQGRRGAAEPGWPVFVAAIREAAAE